MTMIHRAATCCAAIAVAFVAATGSALGANWPDAHLDQLASDVAHRPVSVWCESSWQDWVGVEEMLPGRPDLYGFTIPTKSNVVFLQPTVCETLHVLLATGYENAGNYWTAIALHTLVHESIHQSGIADEGATDCAALALDPVIDAQFVPKTYKYKKLVRVRRRIVTRTLTAPNPGYTRVVAWQHWFHNNVFPAQYRGGCT